MKPIVKHAVAASVLSLCLEGTTLLALKPASAEEVIIKGTPFGEVIFNDQVNRPYKTLIPEYYVPAYRNVYGAYVPGHYVPVPEAYVPAYRTWYGSYPGHYVPIREHYVRGHRNWYGAYIPGHYAPTY